MSAGLQMRSLATIFLLLFVSLARYICFFGLLFDSNLPRDCER